MITHASILAYFTDLANKFKPVNSFFRMDLAEIQGAFRSSADFPAMVLESHDIDLGKSSQTETVNDRAFAFTIYLKPELNNYDEQNDMLNLSEQYGLAIIARIRLDASKPEHLLHGAFDVSEIKAHKVGPVFNEQLYGYRFTGAFEKSEPLKVNPNDWTDDPLVCN